MLGWRLARRTAAQCDYLQTRHGETSDLYTSVTQGLISHPGPNHSQDRKNVSLDTQQSTSVTPLEMLLTAAVCGFFLCVCLYKNPYMKYMWAYVQIYVRKIFTLLIEHNLSRINPEDVVLILLPHCFNVR